MTTDLSDAELAFDKALYLLDEGEVEKGEALLTLVVGAARQSCESVLLARALCVLGESFHERGLDSQALPLLREVANFQFELQDQVEYEQNRAQRILAAVERP
jgi:hypothetical protein